jgi:hypothetical protein
LKKARDNIEYSALCLRAMVSGKRDDSARVGWILVAEAIHNIAVIAKATKFIGVGIGAIKDG